MKRITKQTENAWLSGDYTYYNRAMARVTIQRFHMQLVDYHVPRAFSRTWAHKGKFATAMFGVDNRPRELRNVKSVDWQRGVDTDVATCKVVLYNVTNINQKEIPNRDDFDLPGWYTPNRGEEKYFERWNYESNHWKGWLTPDRLIRTYEGYGYDQDIPPERDSHMYPSGTWLIDTVDWGIDGTITLNCRDVGRLLMDHILFPPVVPWDVYPIYWSKFEQEKNQARFQPPAGSDWHTPDYTGDSNMSYIGLGITDGGEPYVSPTGGVHGHQGRDAFDVDNDSYFLSVGHRPNTPSSYAYVQGKFSSRDVHGVKVKVKGGPYRMYVSLRDEDGWKGRANVPYRFEGDNTTVTDNTTVGVKDVDIEANIPYVAAFTIHADDDGSVRLPRTYGNINAIRLTFTNLWNSRIGDQFRYRVGVRSVQVASQVEGLGDDANHQIGNYGDFTDIIKWYCAWAGFYWPRHGSGLAYWKDSEGRRHHDAPRIDDPILPKGRVWGDLETTGTTGITQLGVELWDKQPVMDGIAQIREMVGYDFWVDETGGVIWRLPNIFSKGNYVMPAWGHNYRNRTKDTVVIDERTTLINLTATTSSANVREFVFVANIAGKHASLVKGYNPEPSHQRRVAGWTDQHFESDEETERMADLIALKQSFLYRQNQVQIAANPAIQVDDQVRIYERVTGEGYLHRVMNISSSIDMMSGKWTYDLTTHWLGEEAFSKWAFDPEDLSERTKMWLRRLGKIP